MKIHQPPVYTPSPAPMPDPSKWLPWVSLILSVLAISLGSYNVVTTAYTGLSTQDNRISNIEKSQTGVTTILVANGIAITALENTDGVTTAALALATAKLIPCEAAVLWPDASAVAATAAFPSAVWVLVPGQAITGVLINNIAYRYYTRTNCP